MRKFAPAGSRPRQRSMPIANSVPRGTVIRVAITPSLMRLQQSGVQRIVVPHRQRLVTPVPAERKALPRGAGLAVVERVEPPRWTTGKQ